MGLFDRLKEMFTAPPVVPPTQPAQPVPAPKPETPASRRILTHRSSDMVAFDGPVTADIAIDLSDSPRLRTLPDGLKTGTLTLANCTALERLPAGIDVAFLDLTGCTSLRSLPDDLRLRGGRLTLAGCTALTTLPDTLGEVAILDLAGCAGITELPPGLIVTSVIDVAGSGLTGLSELYDPVQVRWNGMPVSRQLAFAPETLTREDVAAERDPAIRKLMAERAGF